MFPSADVPFACVPMAVSATVSRCPTGLTNCQSSLSRATATTAAKPNSNSPAPRNMPARFRRIRKIPRCKRRRRRTSDVMPGYLSLVLHAHLPFVRHPEHEHFLEESWLFEAITETYLPLLRVLEGWERDG